RSVGSTGSPLAPEAFDWIYSELGDDVWLASVSGGTDIAGAFIGGAPIVPVYRGELPARYLGVDVQAWDEDGNAMTDEVGELVVVPDIPRTLTGKPLEVPVKKLLMGRDAAGAASKDTLANPAAFDWFVDFARARAA